jgi:hypothetical protein
MKKLAVLFLLVTFAVSAFAIEGIGDFTAGAELGVYNITGGGGISGWGSGFSRKDWAAMSDAAFSIEPFITIERGFDDLGIPGLSASATLGTILRFASGDTAKFFEEEYVINNKKYTNGNGVYDEIYLNLVPSYKLELGPGALTFSLALKPIFFPSVFGRGKYYQDPVFIFNPVANYTTEQDFGTLGFELGTDDMGVAYGLNNKGNGYGLGIADLYLKGLFSMPLPAGSLSVWLSPRIGIKCSDSQGDSRITQIRMDGTYTLNELINFGLELRSPIGSSDTGDNFDAVGQFIKPHVNADLVSIIGLPISAWGALELGHVGAKSPNDELVLNFIVGGSYKF